MKAPSLSSFRKNGELQNGLYNPQDKQLGIRD